MGSERRREQLVALLEQATGLHAAGRLHEAKNVYRRAVRLAPDNDEILGRLGALYGQLGDTGEAEKLLRRAIAIRSNVAAHHINLGVTLKRAARPEEALQCYVRALELEPGNGDALGSLGGALLSLGRAAEAVAPLREATQLRPASAQYHGALAIARYMLGQLGEALAAARDAVRLAPTDSEAHSNLGLILRAAGDLDAAERSLATALSLDAANAIARNNLGLVHLARGDADRAREALEETVRLAPAYGDAWANLAGVHAKLRDFERAFECFAAALSRSPRDERILVEHANALRAAGRLDEALDACRRLGASFPDSAVVRASLGATQLARREYRAALATFAALAAARPGDASARNHLGLCHWALGDAAAAIACFREALAIDPQNATARSNLVLNLNYVPAASREEVYAEHREAGRILEAGLAAVPRAHANSRDPDRRLRVGYVSGDFCEHALSFFTGPVVARHDRARFEVHCFSTGGPSDAVTARFRAHADGWVPLEGVSDARAAELVRERGIDILVDLSGHTALNRLRLFALKPAPVQVHWLGYVNTTGLASIDYRLTDPVLDPVEHGDRWSSERLFRLPVVSAFEPPAASPDPGPLPCLSADGFVFGCLNRAAKCSPEAISTWAEILRAVPGSRLLLGKADDEALRSRLVDAFAARGVPPERVLFMPRMPLYEYLELYRRIDLCLDPFPYNGGATSFHALWMGVPFVALRGDRYMARMGMDLLGHAGLAELVAADERAYVDVAVDLAARRGDLATIRAGLRRRVLESPLGRVQEFVCALEAAYREMWRAWCADPAPGFAHRAARAEPR